MTNRKRKIVGKIYGLFVFAAFMTFLGFGIWKVSPVSTRLWVKVLVLAILGVNVFLIERYRSRDQAQIAENIGRHHGNN